MVTLLLLGSLKPSATQTTCGLAPADMSSHMSSGKKLEKPNKVSISTKTSPRGPYRILICQFGQKSHHPECSNVVLVTRKVLRVAYIGFNVQHLCGLKKHLRNRQNNIPQCHWN